LNKIHRILLIKLLFIKQDEYVISCLNTYLKTVVNRVEWITSELLLVKSYYIK